jgi:DNA repair exonuclease SbcCD ATPase subunit
MSVIFKTIRWKNLLSTGDKFTEIQFDRAPTTLIVGKNGAGKSTMLDALSFVLFGKPHRAINKAQLVNSVNEKTCEVHIDFIIGKHEFTVIRGIKPNRFEIYQNGHMVNQNSAVRDYQKFLEQNILKLNHKSFHQIVVLGSSSFIPFMQLPAHHRREIIEDLLDINIFSKMNSILKETMGKLREELNDLTYQLDMKKEKIELQRKYIAGISTLNEENIEYKQSLITSFEVDIATILTQNSQYTVFIDENKNTTDKRIASVTRTKKTLGQYESTFSQQIRSVVKEAKFYDENETCPTCSQDISKTLREDRRGKAVKRAKDLKDGMEKLEVEISEADARFDELRLILDDISTKNNIVAHNNTLVSKHQKDIAKIQKEIAALSSSNNDVQKEIAVLNQMNEERSILFDKKTTVVEEQRYSSVALEMLKDTGIKTKIIKQYLPVMNKLINQYLQTMDFFVSFNLDENFNETIKSRHRDNFKYSSFSEGEKARIDLALLFTWRQISAMKNSSSTNLLILDETMDSSIDSDGMLNLTRILETASNGSNVFVISHREGLEDSSLFKSKIEFVKEGNFSHIS